VLPAIWPVIFVSIALYRKSRIPFSLYVLSADTN